MKEGDSFTRVFSVTPAIYAGFIDIFGDRNPMHTDELFAREKGFAGKVMHGNILNGFLSYFIGMCLPVDNVIIHTQNIKYSLPVYLNDELELSAVVSGYFESVKAYEFNFSFKNQNGKKVAQGKIQIGIL